MENIVGRARSAETKRIMMGIHRIVRELSHHVDTFTVRQLFYRCTVAGVIDKTEKGYNKIQQLAVEMRQEGLLDDSLFTDTSRSVYTPAAWESPEEALESLANQYAESPWPKHEVEVEVWVEKEALAEIVKGVCEPYHVTVRVMKGYPSRTAMYRAYNAMKRRGAKTTVVYQLCDFDASGQGAGYSAYKAIEEFCQRDEDNGIEVIHGYEFIDLGVTLEQIREWNLPTRPAKEADPRQASFGHKFAVELDAMDPPVFKKLIKDAIEQYLPPQALRVHQAEVESVRNYLRGVAGVKTGGDFFSMFSPK